MATTPNAVATADVTPASVPKTAPTPTITDPTATKPVPIAVTARAVLKSVTIISRLFLTKPTTRMPHCLTVLEACRIVGTTAEPMTLRTPVMMDFKRPQEPARAAAASASSVLIVRPKRAGLLL